MQNSSLLQSALIASLIDLYKPKKEQVRVAGKKRTIEEKVTENRNITETVTRQRPYWIPMILFGASVISLMIFSGMGDIEYGYFAVGGASFVAIVISIIFYSTRKIQVTKTVPFEKIVEKEIQDPDSFEDRIVKGKMKVKEIGKGKLRFSAKLINNKTLLVCEDHDLTIQSLDYPCLANDSKVKEQAGLAEMSAMNVPYVLGPDQDEFDVTPRTTYGGSIRLKGLEKEIMHHFQFMENESRNMENESFRLSTVQDHKLIPFLEGTRAKKINENLMSFYYCIHSEKGLETDILLDRWLTFWEQTNRLFNKLRIKSLSDEISMEFLQLGRTSNYSCFNFYCPECNKDILEDFAKRNYSVQSKNTKSELYFSKSTKCTVNIDRSIWTCPACEKEMKTVIPVHKTLNESFYPVFDKLMEENKNQREKSHSEVRKKEIEFRNEMKKEIDRMFFDNISGILSLRDDMDRMKAEIEGELKAIALMQDLGQRNLEKQSEIIAEINHINENIKQKVQERINIVVQRVDAYMKSEMNAFADKMDRLSKAHQVDQMKRDEVMRGVLDETRNQTAHLEDLGMKMDESNTLGEQQLQESQRGYEMMHNQMGQLQGAVQTGNYINAARAKNEGVDLSKRSDWDDLSNKLQELKRLNA